MEKINKKEKSIQYELEELQDILQSDYCNFNLKILAQKIKSQSYRPKPKMLYL